MKKVTIIGMGALGLTYGMLISRNTPDVELNYIMDEARAEKYRDTVYDINGEAVTFRIITPAEAEVADLVIFSVKGPGLDAAMETAAPCIGEDTLVISVLNGITSEEKIEARFPGVHIVHTVAQGMDSTKLGDTLTYKRVGELRVGILDQKHRADLKRLTEFLDRIKLPYTVEDAIRCRMWSKFMFNVGLNQVCMVYNINYGKVQRAGEANRAMYAAFREVIAVAQAEKINLGEKDIRQYTALLRKLDPDGYPSMAQDRINKKPCEVDMFSGTVVKLAKKHRIAVPTNAWLLSAITEIEGEYIQLDAEL